MTAIDPEAHIKVTDIALDKQNPVLLARYKLCKLCKNRPIFEYIKSLCTVTDSAALVGV